MSSTRAERATLVAPVNARIAVSSSRSIDYPPTASLHIAAGMGDHYGLDPTTLHWPVEAALRRRVEGRTTYSSSTGRLAYFLRSPDRRYLDGHGTPTPAPSPDFLIASRYADVIDTCPGSPKGRGADERVDK